MGRRACTLCALLSGWAGGCLGCAGPQAAPATTPAVQLPNPEPSDQPVARQVEHEWMSLREWRARHRAQLADPVRSTARVVFLGDSITQGWAESSAYQAEFARYRPLGLGIGGDQTQHVLWRLEDGALAGVDAELVVLLIGVNNLGNGHSPEQTQRGVQAVLRRIERDLPSARILLLCILPTGATAADPLRRQVRATNRLLRELASERVTLLDVGGVFLDANQRIAPELMADFLHPTALGYARLTSAVAPQVLRQLDAAAGP